MVNYETYDAVALAQDQSFIRWVQGKDEQSVSFWEKWAQQHPEKADTIKEARQLVESIHFQEESLSEKEKNEMWAQIAVATESEANEGKVRQLRLVQLSYAAALLVLAVAAYFIWLSFSATQIRAGQGERIAHTLPDNTQVELNAASQIKYKGKKWEEERIVQLTGEAMFDVVEGNRFVVKTPNGQVEVLGTRFNVYTRNNELRVDCYSGRVRVSDGTNSLILTPGNRAILRNERMDSTSFELSDRQLWTDGFFDYEGVPLKAVFDEMERQFDIEIEASENILNMTYNGFFENDDLDSAFYSVCFPMGCQEREIREGVYRVEKKE